MDRAYRQLARSTSRACLDGAAAVASLESERRRHLGLLFSRSGRQSPRSAALPEGKGDPKWHRKSERLFLGIDHTAIVVGDTDASLGFYRDALGLSVAGASENYGIEQERLNNVFGARLRITALRAASGPGVELLEYLAPRTGRPMPIDTQANDDWHWQVNVTALVPAADAAVRAGHYAYVSPGPANRRAYDRLMVRDPDGHALCCGRYSRRETTGKPANWPTRQTDRNLRRGTRHARRLPSGPFPTHGHDPHIHLRRVRTAARTTYQ